MQILDIDRKELFEPGRRVGVERLPNDPAPIVRLRPWVRCYRVKDLMQINSSRAEPTMLGEAGDQYSPNIPIARRDPRPSPGRSLLFCESASAPPKQIARPPLDKLALSSAGNQIRELPDVRIARAKSARGLFPFHL